MLATVLADKFRFIEGREKVTFDLFETCHISRSVASSTHWSVLNSKSYGFVVFLYVN